MTAYATPPPDPTSVVGRRIGAWTIDLAIFLAVFFGVLFATGGIDTRTETFANSDVASAACTSFQNGSDGRSCFANGNEVTFVRVEGSSNGVWAGHFVIYCLIQGLAGASLGKLAVGLRVVDAQGKQIGIGKSFLRTVLWIADAITCGLPIIGGVMIVSTKGHRRIGDMAAGTFVVDRSSVGTPLQIPGITPVPWGGSAGYPAQQGMAAPQATWGPPVGAPGQPAAAAAPSGPVWDDARNTYIQYDQGNGHWVQWDADASQWRPIEQ